MVNELGDWKSDPSIVSLQLKTADKLIKPSGKHYFPISSNANHLINVNQFECCGANDWDSPSLYCIDCITSDHPC